MDGKYQETMQPITLSLLSTLIERLAVLINYNL